MTEQDKAADQTAKTTPVHTPEAIEAPEKTAPAQPVGQDAATGADGAQSGNTYGARKTWVGAAVGVGSAAIVAALLYANKRKD
ncbi:MAG: hypothetical protein AB7E60_15305 [Sphingobium sp.]